MFRKTIALCIVFIVLLSVVGYLPLLQLKQWEIRRALAGMDKGSALWQKLEIISITAQAEDALAWEEDELEFNYRGRMYDVVCADTLGPVKHYYCLPDDLDAFLLGSMLEGNTFCKIIKVFFSFLYILSDEAALVNPPVQLVPATSIYCGSLACFIKDILQPPN